MIDLHTHTLFSDGELIPAELTRRAAVAGYRALAMTDHGDLSNLDLIIPRLVRVAADLGAAWGLTVLPGIELTHIPPPQIAAAAREARRLGARIVVCHGETIVEPVAAGTNAAALAADIDILSHPGLLTAGRGGAGGGPRHLPGDHHPQGALADQRPRCQDGPCRRRETGHQQRRPCPRRPGLPGHGPRRRPRRRPQRGAGRPVPEKQRGTGRKSFGYRRLA